MKHSNYYCSHFFFDRGRELVVSHPTTKRPSQVTLLHTSRARLQANQSGNPHRLEDKSLLCSAMVKSPARGKGGPAETPGKDHRGKSANMQVANLTPKGLERQEENEPPEGGDGVGEALGKVTARMYSIQSNLKADLGPVPMANVELEGSEVKALLKWPEGQTQEDWRRQVEKRLEPTPVALCNYEGGNLPVVRQVRAMITRPGYEVEAVMQVQRDAPAELLIGTKLGFLFVRTELETEDVDLLEEHFCRAAGEAEGVCETARANSPGRGTGTVCLLQAARLPGHLEGRGMLWRTMGVVQ